MEVDGAPAGPTTSSAVYRCTGGNVTGYSGGDSDYLLHVPAGPYFFRADWNGDPTSLSLRFTDVSPPQAAESCTFAGAPLQLELERLVRVARRWTSQACGGFPWCPGSAIDIVPKAPGLLVPTGVWTDERGINGPSVFYLCDAACPSDPASTCVMDAYTNTAGPGTTFEILGRPVAAGETLHLATGPNSPADLYSFNLFLAPP